MDAHNCVVLDRACSSTVCSQLWMNNLLDSIEPDDRSFIRHAPCEKVFKFGTGEKLKTKTAISIPAFLAGHAVHINTDVIDNDIPLLLSKDVMKRAKVKLDLKSDSAEVLGKSESLNLISSANYRIPTNKTILVQVESVCGVNIDKLDSKEKYKTLQKLHKQLVHPI